ncbi:PilT/PilU family type 4a pilus ATPase [Candidatus Sumerlaeota bacterium]|nr:PilT/PilU family type 4a pilus ATPase [Candidatus Sumerlaeota bacterium]
MRIELNAILDGASKIGASDIHLNQNNPPYLRVDGILRPIQAPPLDHETLAYYLKSMMPAGLEPAFEEKRGIDFGYQYGVKVRFRVNAYYERSKMKIVLRSISLHIPSIDDLDLPETLKRVSMLRRGMVLVTGATGSGKSTTLAAMIQYVNEKMNRCIITIEDPIEYIYENKTSIVTQREVGVDVPDFNTGLVQALRQDPDVILIGEMRSSETMAVAIKAAQTGHLVFSTLHTINAVQTIERVLGSFPQDERELVREELSFNLKAAISQRLIRRAGGKGRIAAMELMIVTTTIEKLIHEDRIRDIPGVLRGREDGMMLYDQSLADLVREGKIEQAEAERHCDDVFALRRFIKGVKSTGETGGIIAGFGG